MQHVFIIGGTTFDHIISLPEFPNPMPQSIHQALFNETTGSTGAGKALALTKLKISNTLYSVLGNDAYGQRIIQHLDKESVDFIYDWDPKGTERHVNLMDKQGRRISIFVTLSSEHPPINIQRVAEQFKKSDVVVLNIISYCKNIIPLLANCNKPIWTDLHDYTDNNPYHEPFIVASDVIFLSSDNLPDYKQTMKGLMARGKELVVCTHGNGGSTALNRQGDWFYEPALNDFSLIDANGAGDNYFAGFLFAYLKGYALERCIKYGSLCGAYCLTSKQLVYEKLSKEFLEKVYHIHYKV
ncbi:MAG: kinase [Bacteroidetes bacterium HGW-Bacteroidetes-4]|nr:MAG: kinase [Bacteroidetes bacterium HGW-Bacteroidetes-4]